MFASAMTKSVLPPDILKGLKPELIAPFVGVLTAKNVFVDGRNWAFADGNLRAQMLPDGPLSSVQAFIQRFDGNVPKVGSRRWLGVSPAVGLIPY